jgi:hypothetical protein
MTNGNIDGTEGKEQGTMEHGVSTLVLKYRFTGRNRFHQLWVNEKGSGCLVHSFATHAFSARNVLILRKIRNGNRF